MNTTTTPDNELEVDIGLDEFIHVDRLARAKVTADGFREFADLIEHFPELAEAAAGQSVLVYASSAKKFRMLLSQLGGDRDKAPDENYMKVLRNFGDAVRVQLYTAREQVCTARVVGQETVEVPDPDAPKVTVTRDVVEWDCHPVLDTEAVPS